jgi:beta-lactamase class A
MVIALAMTMLTLISSQPSAVSSTSAQSQTIPSDERGRSTADPAGSANACSSRGGPSLSANPAAGPVAAPAPTATGVATAPSTHPTADRALEELLNEVLGASAPHYGVVIKETRGGTGAEINPDQLFYAASLFKLPIMVEVFRQRSLGQLGLDDVLVADSIDLAEDLGTFRGDVGDPFTVHELLDLMITLSDNTSAIMLMRSLPGRAVDGTMRDLGLEDTSVTDWELPTTAHDMALLMEAIALGWAVDTDASGEMLELLLRQTWRSRIPAGVPEGVPVGNKTGDWFDAAHDVAVVFAPRGIYVIAVLSDGGGSDATFRELSRRVYEYYEGC